MVAKPLCPLYKNIIKPLDRARYPELRYDGGFLLQYQTAYPADKLFRIHLVHIKLAWHEFRLYLSALAYILLQDVRHKMLRKSSLKASTLITLRNKIIFSPVKVTEQKTQIKVEFQPKHPKRGWIHWNLKVA